MARFTVYQRDDCPYCRQATAFLLALQQERDDVQVKLVDQYKDPAKVRAAQRRVGRNTVPQVFLDGHHIGGWDDLARWAQQGSLDLYFEQGEFRAPQKPPGLFARLFRRAA